MRRGTQITREEAGFTLVELMVAAFVLTVGMLSIVGMLQTGIQKTTLNNQRVAATNFIREVTETARQVPYNQLTPSGAASVIQAADSPDLGTGNPWQVVRRDTKYTVTPTVCTFDDPADGIASVAPANRCTDNPTAGVPGKTDQNGDDFRRLTLTLTWFDGAKAATFTQATLIANPSGGLGPRITSFTGPSSVITSGNFANFVVTTTFAASVHWNADDGVSNGDATGGFTSWNIAWDLKGVNSTGSVVDGTYSLTAQAADDRGVAGEARSAQVTVNRTAPRAPSGFRGGHNTRAGDWVEFEWNLNPARDIIGYRVYWAGADAVPNTADDQRVCPAASATSSMESNKTTACQVLSPPTLATSDYFVVAYDHPTPVTGTPRPGALTKIQVVKAGSQPSPPTNPSRSGVDTPTLHWSAPASATAPAYYRIYRDGTALADRIGRTGALEFTDTGADDMNHQYWVTAVNDEFNESSLVAFQ